MTQQACTRRQEERAAQLLGARLKAHGYEPVTWKRSLDPPDFEFEVGKERWAVEVTRSDQRVRRSGENVSRDDRDRKLIDFGNQIAGTNRAEARLYYVLTLRPLQGVTDKRPWRDRVSREVPKAIETGNEGPFTLDPHGCAVLKGFSEWPSGFGVLLDSSRATRGT